MLLGEQLLRQRWKAKLFVTGSNRRVLLDLESFLTRHEKSSKETWKRSEGLWGFHSHPHRGPPIIETKSGPGYMTTTHSYQVIPQIRCKHTPQHWLWGWLPEPQLLFNLLGYSFSLPLRLCTQQQVQCLQYSRRASWLQQMTDNASAGQEQHTE